MRFALIAAAVVLSVSSVQAQQQQGSVRLPDKPNLSETNLRDPPKSTPNAGSPADYLLISADKIGGAHYLRFDIPLKEVKIDDETVLTAEVGPADGYTLILKPRAIGGSRVLVFGAENTEFTGPGKRLIYDAMVAVGRRVVTIREKGIREVMDCAPGCYPSPTSKQREPDQIIENRSR